MKTLERTIHLVVVIAFSVMASCSSDVQRYRIDSSRPFLYGQVYTFYSESLHAMEIKYLGSKTHESRGRVAHRLRTQYDLVQLRGDSDDAPARARIRIRTLDYEKDEVRIPLIELKKSWVEVSRAGAETSFRREDGAALSQDALDVLNLLVKRDSPYEAIQAPGPPVRVGERWGIDADAIASAINHSGTLALDYAISGNQIRGEYRLDSVSDGYLYIQGRILVDYLDGRKNIRGYPFSIARFLADIDTVHQLPIQPGEPVRRSELRIRTVLEPSSPSSAANIVRLVTLIQATTDLVEGPE